MWEGIKRDVEQAVLGRIRSLFGQAPERLVFETPPDLEMGDLAIPVCFELARSLRKAPRKIAEEIVPGIELPPSCARAVVAGAGYINLFLDRNFLIRELEVAARSTGPASSPAEQGKDAAARFAQTARRQAGLAGAASGPAATPKAPSEPARLPAGFGAADDSVSPLVPAPLPGAPPAIVEHTNINPNKAAHIGHLRNAVLGDTLARLLRQQGRRVEVQNYIDDTGVQVADVVIGLRELEGITDVAGLERLPAPFDYACWDVYSRVMDLYQRLGEEAPRLRSRTLKRIEEGEGEEAAMAAAVAGRNVRRHLGTMGRIGVSYDLLAWEGEILRLRFWEQAFALLRERGAAVLEAEGKNRGCWVMPLKASERFAEMEDPDKVLVRSDGTVTYVGKDLAYQLWKFGLLGRDFNYRLFGQDRTGHPLWATASGAAAAEAGAGAGGETRSPGVESPERGAGPAVAGEGIALPGSSAVSGVSPPAFLGGRRLAGKTVYNVIDVRQSYLQRIVSEGLRVLGHEEESERSVHFAYEMVALSPATAKELGLPVSAEDEGKSFVEMSGRKGLGVKADDLLDTLESDAGKEVAARNPELPEEERRELARAIARGALRYFMLKFTRNKVIVFDLREALSFEGESGPYVQYAAVRAANILRKLDGFSEERARETAAAYDFERLPEDERRATWEVVHLLSSLEETAAAALDALEPALVAHYAFSLAQKFNNYYHRFRILQEPDPRLRGMRALLVHLFARRMSRALDLLGIPVPERM